MSGDERETFPGGDLAEPNVGPDFPVVVDGLTMESAEDVAENAIHDVVEEDVVEEKSIARGEAERDDPTSAPPLFEDEPAIDQERLEAWRQATLALDADPRGCCEEYDDEMMTDQGRD